MNLRAQQTTARRARGETILRAESPAGDAGRAQRSSQTVRALPAGGGHGCGARGFPPVDAVTYNPGYGSEERNEGASVVARDSREGRRPDAIWWFTLV